MTHESKSARTGVVIYSLFTIFLFSGIELLSQPFLNPAKMPKEDVTTERALGGLCTRVEDRFDLLVG